MVNAQKEMRFLDLYQHHPTKMCECVTWELVTYLNQEFPHSMLDWISKKDQFQTKDYRSMNQFTFFLQILDLVHTHFDDMVKVS